MGFIRRLFSTPQPQTVVQQPVAPPPVPEPAPPPPTVNEAVQRQDSADMLRRKRGARSTIIVPDSSFGTPAPSTGLSKLLGQ